MMESSMLKRLEGYMSLPNKQQIKLIAYKIILLMIIENANCAVEGGWGACGAVAVVSGRVVE